MKFNIEHFSDGMKMKYGNCYGICLEEAVEELIYFDAISNLYNENEIQNILLELKTKRTFGTRWAEITVTLNNTTT